MGKYVAMVKKNMNLFISPSKTKTLRQYERVIVSKAGQGNLGKLVKLQYTDNPEDVTEVYADYCKEFLQIERRVK